MFLAIGFSKRNYRAKEINGNVTVQIKVMSGKVVKSFNVR